jgi:hypothetical protein
MSPKLLVDGHVHFHDCFTWQAFLDAAVANFAAARRQLNLGDDSPGCLMFTESAGVNYYQALLNEPRLASGWHVDKGDDGCSMALSRNGKDTIVIVAGRQIVTREHLEVLALGGRADIPDQQPIGDVLRAVVGSGAIAVIPWGFGKWLGRRGRLLRDLIESESSPPFGLGDNGGRPAMTRRPLLFEWAEHRGLLVLPGSDPLPMRNQIRRPASYGFVLDTWGATSRPAAAIKARIQSLRQSPPVFGKLSSVPRMILSQLEIRWRQRQMREQRRKTTVPQSSLYQRETR